MQQSTPLLYCSSRADPIILLLLLQINLPLPYQILVVLGHAVFGAFEYKRFTNFQKYGEVSHISSLQAKTSWKHVDSSLPYVHKWCAAVLVVRHALVCKIGTSHGPQP